MLTKPKTCQHCPLYDKGLGYVPMKGSASNGVLLLTDMPTKDECQFGQPMSGKSGFFVTQSLARGGMRREEFAFHNVLSCRPPFGKLYNQPYQYGALDNCAPYVENAIKKIKPKVIVAAGALAFRRTTGLSHSVLKSRGYVFESNWSGIWVVATYHPGYILSGKTELTHPFIHDVKHAVEIAQEGYQHGGNKNFVLDPSPERFRAWTSTYLKTLEKSPDTLLAYDIETPYKGGDEDKVKDEDASYNILRLGLSYGRADKTVSIPFSPEYLSDIQRGLGSEGGKVVWNTSFDTPRLRYRGCPVNGPIHDGMVAWHVLNSDLPKGLEFVTPFFCPDQSKWKHINDSNPALYNAIDAEVEWRNMEGIEKELRTNGLWEVYERYVLKLDPVLAYMSMRGMPIDLDKREEFALALDAKVTNVFDKMQEVHPDEIKNTSPAMGYKKAPKDTTGMVEISVSDKVKRCISCSLINPTKAHSKPKRVKYCARCGEITGAKSHVKSFAKKENPCAGAKLKERDENPCSGCGTTEAVEEISRWAKLVPFKPSKPQCLTYMSHMKHGWIFTGKGKDKKASSDVKAIKKQIGSNPDDPLYRLILEYRELGKVSSTYIGKIKWNPLAISLTGSQTSKSSGA